jgi:hypothetical protein
VTPAALATASSETPSLALFRKSRVAAKTRRILVSSAAASRAGLT